VLGFLLIQNTLGGLSYGKVLANVVSGLILALGVIAALNQLQIEQQPYYDKAACRSRPLHRCGPTFRTHPPPYGQEQQGYDQR